MRDPALVAAPSVDPATVRVTFEYVASATVWLLVGTTIWLIASIKLHWPEFLPFAWLSFGRVRPAHTSLVLLGGGSLVLVGLCLYVVSRTSRVPLWSPRLARSALWLWNLTWLRGHRLVASLPPPGAAGRGEWHPGVRLVDRDHRGGRDQAGSRPTPRRSQVGRSAGARQYGPGSTHLIPCSPNLPRRFLRPVARKTGTRCGDPNRTNHLGLAESLQRSACMSRRRIVVAIVVVLGWTALAGAEEAPTPPAATRALSNTPFQLVLPREHLLGDWYGVRTWLYTESGLLGMSGISSDMRWLLASADPSAKLAVDVFVYRIRRELGSLAAALGGLDSIVFIGGIREHSAAIRERVCQDAAWLGIELDAAANARGGPRLTTGRSRVSRG